MKNYDKKLNTGNGLFELRKYQKKAVTEGLNVLKDDKGGKEVVVAPTGSGKSLIIAKVVQMLDEPCIVLQPSKELLKQNYTKFVGFGGEASIFSNSLKTKTVGGRPVTEINGERKYCDEIGKVTFATIGSIKKRVSDFKRIGVKHVIIDECHLMTKSGSMIKKFLKLLNVNSVLGLTATPLYLNQTAEGAKLTMINRTRGGVFRNIRYVVQIKDVVKQGFWAKMNYKVVEGDESFLVLNSAGTDFTDFSQMRYYKENDLGSKIKREVEHLKKSGRKRILIFTPTIHEAMSLYGQIPNSGVVHSKMTTEERDFMIDSFNRGEIPVIINCNILSTGYDNPEIDAIIMARPSNSFAMIYQQIGRGCRPHKDKKDCLVIDYVGNIKRIGKIEDVTFEKTEYTKGWAAFNGELLLTGYPLGNYQPTRSDLQKNFQRDLERKKPKEVIMPFGKYKGKTISWIAEKDLGYLVWMTTSKDFVLESGFLKDAIKEQLTISSIR